MSKDVINTAMDLIAEMDPGDPGGKVKERLTLLERTLDETSEEYEQFGDLWEAYLASK